MSYLEIIEKHNNTYHRLIKCTSTFAREPSRIKHVFQALYGKVQPITPPKYEAGDRVRNVKKKKTFEKGFTPNWTEELCTIDKVKHTKSVTHIIEDTKGEEVHGTFYDPELQKTKEEIYGIEIVFKKRRSICEVEML